MFLNIWLWYRSCWIIQKSQKMHFWMIQRATIEVFGHVLVFGLLYRLDIAYYDSSKCFPTFGNVTRSWRIIQKSQKCIFEWSKVPKKRFLDIFRSFVCWIDLIMHIVKELNVIQRLATLSGHDGSFKNNKNAFLNDPKCQNPGFWSFYWVRLVRLVWYCRFW